MASGAEGTAVQPADSVSRWAFIIAAGTLATTLSQPGVLDLPFRTLLREELGASQIGMSTFFALGSLPWYLKPLAGLVSDCFPLFGTRRRHYLIFGASLASLLWLVVGVVPRSYYPVLLAVLAVNAMLVMASTVLGGILVEAGQRLGATDRLVTVRMFVDSACGLVGGTLSGLLAGLPFMVAAIAGAGISFVIVPIAIWSLHEPPLERGQASPFREAWEGLASLAASRIVWAVAGFVLLASIPQAFSTPLYFHQTNSLKLPVEVIGTLASVAEAGGLPAALLYGFYSRRTGLRARLLLGLLCTATAILLYVFYQSLAAAYAIDAARGFLYTLGALPLMELAVLATPRRVAALGFAVLMSVLNAGSAIGDLIGAALDSHGLGFFGLMGVYAGATALLACAVRYLPEKLVSQQS